MSHTTTDNHVKQFAKDTDDSVSFFLLLIRLWLRGVVSSNYISGVYHRGTDDPWHTAYEGNVRVYSRPYKTLNRFFFVYILFISNK